MKKSQILSSVLSSVYILWMATIDLAGVFNLGVLHSCFEGKLRNSFLPQCRNISICPCACQVTILVMNAVATTTTTLALYLHDHKTLQYCKSITIIITIIITIKKLLNKTNQIISDQEFDNSLSLISKQDDINCTNCILR